MISRTHPGLVRRLFEQEVPEIFDGTIEIKSVSREAGSRTKIAVFSKEEDVDPVGLASVLAASVCPILWTLWAARRSTL